MLFEYTMFVLSHFCRVQVFVTLWTLACKAPLSMGFSRLKSTGVSCYALLQGIFPIQGSNLHHLMPCALAGGFFTTSATWEASLHTLGTNIRRWELVIVIWILM